MLETPVNKGIINLTFNKKRRRKPQGRGQVGRKQVVY